MDLLEFALIFTVVFILYNLQQIKITLKEKGFTVDVFKGTLEDYRKFKDLIRNESNQTLKMKYQKSSIACIFHCSASSCLSL